MTELPDQRIKAVPFIAWALSDWTNPCIAPRPSVRCDNSQYDVNPNSYSLNWYWSLILNHNWFTEELMYIHMLDFYMLDFYHLRTSISSSPLYVALSICSPEKVTRNPPIVLLKHFVLVLPVRIQWFTIALIWLCCLIGCRVAFWKKRRPCSLGWVREKSKPNLSEKNWSAFWTSFWISSSLYPKTSLKNIRLVSESAAGRWKCTCRNYSVSMYNNLGIRGNLVSWTGLCCSGGDNYNSEEIGKDTLGYFFLHN